ncbi:MAG: HAD-IA family hydrolase [Treponema sp.]|jgi:putative hydrolase of the HAD superfamily|nr:HAD-IA family hydrolase [Treponema sp.]
MNTIKAVFFDYDGTMTYDSTGIESICNYISQYMNINKDIFEKEYRKYVGDLIFGKTFHEDIWDELCAGLGMNIPIAFLFHSFNQTPIDHDMHDFVLKIKAKGYKTGLITGNFSDRVVYLKQKFDLNKYFDIFAVSGELGYGKQTEKIFFHALEQLGIQPDESVFIDNQNENLLIPRKIGMRVIYFCNEKRDMAHLVGNLQKYGVEI